MNATMPNGNPQSYGKTKNMHNRFDTNSPLAGPQWVFRINNMEVSRYPKLILNRLHALHDSENNQVNYNWF